MSNSENSNQLEDFLTWCKINGAEIDNRIDFQVREKSGISAVAKDAIPVQERPLIDVPQKLLISNETALKAFGTDGVSNPNALLRLFLAKSKFNSQEDGYYSPYINILPLQLEQPHYWDKAELELLRGTDLFSTLKHRLKDSLQEWSQVIEELQIQTCEDEPAVHESVEQLLSYLQDYKKKHGTTLWTSFYAYLWAADICNSRAFPKLLLDNTRTVDRKECFLLPIVDLLNHKNGTKVKWTSSGNDVHFVAQEAIDQKAEIFNNYGDKSNEELLLNYGFVEQNNPYDIARITLRLDSAVISQTSKKLEKDERAHIIDDNCAEFELKLEDKTLPKGLVTLFAYLLKLKSEERPTMRSALEGLDSISDILSQKVQLLKEKLKFKTKTSRSDRYDMIKTYLNSQKRIYQHALESVSRSQKPILQAAIGSFSFKTAIKNDRQFSNSLLLIYGASTFEEIVQKNLMKTALLLWIVRVTNLEDRTKSLGFQIPPFIQETFASVSDTITIEKEDVLEHMDYYKQLFPRLSTQIPEVYNRGNWGIRQFIVADTVIDRLVWTKPATGEAIFLAKQDYE